MKIKNILLAALFWCPCLCAGPAFAQTASRTSLEAKLALENSLEKRVRLVLAEALGTEDIIVIISAELQEQEKKSSDILPGIPEKGKMGEPSLSSSLTMVKKLSASLILDKAVTEADTQLARKLAGGLLGLPADRQDLITVEKMDFRKAKPLTLTDLFLPPNLWSLVWVLVVALLAILTVFAFLSPLSKSAKAFVEAFTARNTAPAAADRPSRMEEEALDRAAARQPEKAAPAGIDGRKPPFWFLNAGHASSLAFILKTRTAEDITIVLNYAPHDLAAKLAEALYPRSVEALAALPRVKQMEEARIKELETEILSALDYVVGGEEKALEILSGLDEAVQEKALSAFSRLDPALSRKLAASIVRLSDVAALDSQQALLLARRLPMRVLAAALKGTPHSAPFLASLTGGMQERLRQELDLTRNPAGDGYKEDKAKVVETLRQLIKEGFITPGAHAAPKPAAAAPKPAATAPKPAAQPAGQKPQPAPATKPAPAAPSAAAPKP